MSRVLDPFRFVLIAVAGWMNQHQLQIIDYLRDENRVLREQLGGRRVRFNDDQRRRLAAKAKRLGRPDSGGGLTIVTPETLLAWRRRLTTNKYDGTAQRGLGAAENIRRPREVGGPTRRGQPNFPGPQGIGTLAASIDWMKLTTLARSAGLDRVSTPPVPELRCVTLFITSSSERADPL
jgi:hypothetical protein